MAVKFDIVSGIALCVILLMMLIYTPLLIRSLQYFRLITQKKKNKFITMRHPLLVYLINCICAFVILVERPLLACIFVFNLFKLPVWLIELFYALSWFPLFICLSFKTYLLYYNQQLSLSIMNQAWQKEINMGVTDWYIANHNSWGNPIWLIKVFSIPFILGVAAIDILHAIYGKSVVLYIIDMSVCLLPIGVAIYTMYQTRLLSDIYGIRKETRYQTLSVFVYLLLYIISFTLFQILPFNSDNGIISRIQWLLFIIFTQTLAFVITFLTSTYPIYLFRKYNYTTKRIKHKRKKERKAAKSDPKSDKNANRVTLQRFIQTEAGFKLFMQHLASEFSTENLLFIVELIQIKHGYQLSHGNVLKLPRKIELPPDMIEETLQRQNTGSLNDNDKYMTIDFNTKKSKKHKKYSNFKHNRDRDSSNRTQRSHTVANLLSNNNSNKSNPNASTLRNNRSKSAFGRNMAIDTTTTATIATTVSQTLNNSNTNLNTNKSNKEQRQRQRHRAGTAHVATKSHSTSDRDLNSNKRRSSSQMFNSLRGLSLKNQVSSINSNNSAISKEDNHDNASALPPQFSAVNSVEFSDGGIGQNQDPKLPNMSNYSSNSNDGYVNSNINLNVNININTNRFDTSGLENVHSASYNSDSNSNWKDNTYGKNKKKKRKNKFKSTKSFIPTKMGNSHADRVGNFRRMLSNSSMSNIHGNVHSKSNSISTVSMQNNMTSFGYQIKHPQSPIINTPEYHNMKSNSGYSFNNNNPGSNSVSVSTTPRAASKSKRVMFTISSSNKNKSKTKTVVRSKSLNANNVLSGNPNAVLPEDAERMDSLRGLQNVTAHPQIGSLGHSSLHGNSNGNYSFAKGKGSGNMHKSTNSAENSHQGSRRGSVSNTDGDASRSDFGIGATRLVLSDVISPSGSNFGNGNGNGNGNRVASTTATITPTGDAVDFVGVNVSNPWAIAAQSDGTMIIGLKDGNTGAHSNGAHAGVGSGGGKKIVHKHSHPHHRSQRSHSHSAAFPTLETQRTPTIADLGNSMGMITTVHSMDEMLDNLKVDHMGIVGSKPTSFLFGRNGKIAAKIVLPAGLPISRLMLANNNLFDQMNALYEKYVKRGSLLEINISGEMRSFLDNFFAKPRSQLMELTKQLANGATLTGHSRQNTASNLNFAHAFALANINGDVDDDIDDDDDINGDIINKQGGRTVGRPAPIIVPMSPSADEEENEIDLRFGGAVEARNYHDDNDNDDNDHHDRPIVNPTAVSNISNVSNSSKQDDPNPAVDANGDGDGLEDHLGLLVDNLTFSTKVSNSILNDDKEKKKKKEKAKAKETKSKPDVDNKLEPNYDNTTIIDNQDEAPETKMMQNDSTELEVKSSPDESPIDEQTKKVEIKIDNVDIVDNVDNVVDNRKHEDMDGNNTDDETEHTPPVSKQGSLKPAAAAAIHGAHHSGGGKSTSASATTMTATATATATVTNTSALEDGSSLPRNDTMSTMSYRAGSMHSQGSHASASTHTSEDVNNTLEGYDTPSPPVNSNSQNYARKTGDATNNNKGKNSGAQDKHMIKSTADHDRNAEQADKVQEKYVAKVRHSAFVNVMQSLDSLEEENQDSKKAKNIENNNGKKEKDQKKEKEKATEIDVKTTTKEGMNKTFIRKNLITSSDGLQLLTLGTTTTEDIDGDITDSEMNDSDYASDSENDGDNNRNGNGNSNNVFNGVDIAESENIKNDDETILHGNSTDLGDYANSFLSFRNLFTKDGLFTPRGEHTPGLSSQHSLTGTDSEREFSLDIDGIMDDIDIARGTSIDVFGMDDDDDEDEFEDKHNHEPNSYLSKLNRLAFNVFDQTALELMNLMQDSFGRFTRTREYLEFNKKVQKERIKVNKNKNKNKHKKSKKYKKRKSGDIGGINSNSNYNNNNLSVGYKRNSKRGNGFDMPQIRNATSYDDVLARANTR